MGKSSKLIGFTAAAALGVGLALALRPADVPPSGEAGNRAIAMEELAGPAASTSLLPPVPAGAASGGPPVAPPRQMLHAFNASHSYRTFVYQALKKPAAGWYHYAYYALRACEEADNTPEQAMADRQRNDALSALRQRCDMSAAERAAVQSQLQAVPGSEFDDDAVMKASAAWLLHATAGEERAALSTILASADPIVLANLALPSRARQDGKEDMGTYFLGQYHDSGQQSTFYYAFRLALCDLGLDCGASATQTLLLCSHQGWCGASYGEALRLGMQGDPSRYAQVLALAAQLSQALRGKDVAAFAERKS